MAAVETVSPNTALPEKTVEPEETPKEEVPETPKEEVPETPPEDQQEEVHVEEKEPVVVEAKAVEAAVEDPTSETEVSVEKDDVPAAVQPPLNTEAPEEGVGKEEEDKEKADESADVEEEAVGKEEEEEKKEEDAEEAPESKE